MAEIKTLVDLFESSCRVRGDAPLFGTRQGNVFKWISYSEIHRRVAQVRSLLRALGVVRGDRIALIADNSVDWATICYATAGCAAIAVPMYPEQRPSDWEFVLRDCRPKVVFLGSKSVAATYGRIQGTLPFVEHLIVIQGDENDGSTLSARLRRLSEATAEIEPPLPDDPADFIYTSGTMGQPKGVILSHNNIVANVRASTLAFPLFSSDRTLSFLPWAHCFGQTVDLHLMLHVGAQIGINGDITSLMTNLQLVRPTILIAVPRVFFRIRDGVHKQMAERPAAIQRLFRTAVTAATKRAQGDALNIGERLALMTAEPLIFRKVRKKFGGNLRFAISGSAALSRSVAEFVTALGIEVYEGYGLTEASPVVSVNTPGYRKFGTVGKAIPGVTIAIDRTVTQDPQVGEIVIQGPSVMKGYHGAPEDTARVLTADGGLRTGDLGYLDPNGYLVITGRLKEQFKLQNGRYVAPAPIEEHIKQSPLISNCVLYGADRPFCVLLVVPAQARVEDEARQRGLTVSNCTEDPLVYGMLKNDISARTREFQSYMRPKKLLILADDFTVDNGFMTPSMKVRRQEVINRYSVQLSKLYADSTVV
jgi:long-chain acyl-CoA synthetase